MAAVAGNCKNKKNENEMTPWFRFYNEAINDPKVLLLPTDTLRWQWVVMLSVASQHGGVIPSVQHAALALRMNGRSGEKRAAEVVSSLAYAGLLDQVEGGYFAPHNWSSRQYKSDVSTDRVREFRERDKERRRNVSSTVSETPSETETETETETERGEALTSQIPHSKNSKVFSVKNGEKDGSDRSGPRHGARSKARGTIYFRQGTTEWDAYADDYKSAHNGAEPTVDRHGGHWFKYEGEIGWRKQA